MLPAFLNQSLWLDEAVSYFAVKNYGFWEIITKFSPGDVHPPLYYLILKLWTGVFGYSEMALRAPSLLAAILAVVIVFRINKLAALFLAINPLVIYYAMEARMYSMVMLAVTLAFYFWTKKNNWGFILSFAAAIYLDYFPLLLVPVFLPFSLLTLIFVLPLVPLIWPQLWTSAMLAKNVPLWGQVVGGASLKALLLVPIKFIFGRIPSNIVMAPIIAVYVWLLSGAKARILWLWLVVPPILGFLISLKVPIFAYHRFLFVMPAFCLLLAERTAKNKLAIGFISLIGLISLIIFIINPNNYREDWRGATAYINSDPGKVLMPNTAQSPALVYYGAKMNEKESPVYLIRYVQEIFDPTDSLRLKLENTGYKNIAQKNFNGVVIWKYTL